MKKSNILLLIVIILVVVGYNKLDLLFPFKHFETVKNYSEQYDIDPLLTMALIKTESKFKQDALSHKSAKGLMQITDNTGEWCADKMGIKDFNPDMLYDVETNIKIGTFYFDHLLDKYNGELSSTVAAYNAGMGNVDKWLKDSKYSADGKILDRTPFSETTAYINKIKFNYKMYKLIYGGRING